LLATGEASSGRKVRPDQGVTFDNMQFDHGGQ
jgi:hypothetical protein